MSKERQAIYDKTGGKCYYCGCDLPKRWHADHVESLRRGYTHESAKRLGYKKGADTVDNKVPSCPRCNIRKSTMSVETFRREIKAQVKRLKNNNQFNLALDYGLIEIKDKEVEFYFERMRNE